MRAVGLAGGVKNSLKMVHSPRTWLLERMAFFMLPMWLEKVDLANQTKDASGYLVHWEYSGLGLQLLVSSPQGFSPSLANSEGELVLISNHENPSL